MGACIVPAITGGLGLLGGLITNRPQEYRQTPFQQQMGSFMGNLMQQGGTQMPADMFGQFQQAYAMPQSAQWAAGIMPQMFGGGGMGGGFGMPPQMGMGAGMSGMGFPQQPPPQMGGWGGPGGGGFGMNPFATGFGG